MLTNIIVAISNFIPLLLFLSNRHVNVTSSQLLQLLIPMFASFMFHLSDTRYGQTGIAPLNTYTNIFLFIDRIFAAIAAWTVVAFIRKCIKLPNTKNIDSLKNLIILAGVGITSLGISEGDTIVPSFAVEDTDFVLFHVVWHICAFYCLHQAIFL